MIEENIGARKRNAQALSKGISDVKSMHIVHTTVKLSTRNVEVQLSLVFSDFAVWVHQQTSGYRNVEPKGNQSVGCKV